MVKHQVPEAPKAADYPAHQEFKFITKIVDVGEEPVFQLPLSTQFVGVVQVPGKETYQAIFIERSTPFEKASAEYDAEIQALLNIATEEGATITSLEDLQNWANRVPQDNDGMVLDFAAAIEKMKEE